MTGQVKEEILTRFGELGVSIQHGTLTFNPTLLRNEEFMPAAGTFACVDVTGGPKTLSLPPGSLAFTICQTPVVYVSGDHPRIDVTFGDGRQVTLPGRSLDAAISQHIFDRDGQIERLHVTVSR